MGEQHQSRIHLLYYSTKDSIMMITSKNTNREFDVGMNATLENSGFRGHESTVKGIKVTRKYRLFDVAKQRREQRRKRLNLDSQPPVETSDITLKMLHDHEIRILQTQNNEISNSCKRGLLASQEQLDTIEQIVKENKYEHMSLAQIQVYLDDTNYFQKGHVLSAPYFRSIAKGHFKQKDGRKIVVTKEVLDTIGGIVRENNYEHMTIPQIQAYLDDTNYFQKGHGLSAPYFSGIAKGHFKQRQAVFGAGKTLASQEQLDTIRAGSKKTLASQEQLDTIEQIVKENKYEHMTIPQIQAYLDDTNYFQKGHGLSAPYFRSIAKGYFRVGKWTIAEDELLRKSVTENNAKNWDRIAQAVPGRLAKRCRERWDNHLDPNVTRSEWTEEEDKIIIQVHGEMGNKWAEIAKCLNGRTNNAIKNRYNTTLKRLIKESQVTGNPVDLKSIKRRPNKKVEVRPLPCVCSGNDGPESKKRRLEIPNANSRRIDYGNANYRRSVDQSYPNWNSSATTASGAPQWASHPQHAWTSSGYDYRRSVDQSYPNWNSSATTASGAPQWASHPQHAWTSNGYDYGRSVDQSYPNWKS